LGFSGGAVIAGTVGGAGSGCGAWATIGGSDGAGEGGGGAASKVSFSTGM